MSTLPAHPVAPAAPTSAGTLWRSWLVYSLSSVAGRIVGLVMLPVYTRVLTPEEYGIRALVTVGVDLVGMLCSFGVTTAMVRFYTGEHGERPRPEAVSTAYAAAAVVLATGVGLGMAAAPWLAVLVLGDAAHAGYLRLGLLSLFFMNTMAVGLAYLRLRQRAATVAAVSFATLGLTIASNVALVVWLRWGVAGILYGEILTYSLFSLILARMTLREVGVRVSLALGRQMLAYGAPLVLMPMAWLLVNRADAVFLAHHGSLTDVGIYALAVQCAQVLLVAVILPFRDAWEPGQFEVARAPDGARTYRRLFQTFTFTVVVAGFAFAIGAEDVLGVLAPPAFHGAAAVIPIVLAAYAVMGMSLFFNSALLVTGRTARLGGIALVAAVVNLAANAILVPRYFAPGAATARLLALLVMATLTYALGRRLWSSRPDLVALGKLLALALAGYGVAQMLPDETLVVSLLLKATLVLFLIGGCAMVGAVDRRDLARVSTRVLEHLARPRGRPASSTLR
jgi:O-antigen/teichoic acid export membrane protein